MKLWKLSDPSESASRAAETYDVSLLAEFSSCFGKRIMCVDASEDEVISVSIISMLMCSVTFFIVSSFNRWTDAYYFITMVN